MKNLKEVLLGKLEECVEDLEDDTFDLEKKIEELEGEIENIKVKIEKNNSEIIGVKEQIKSITPISESSLKQLVNIQSGDCIYVKNLLNQFTDIVNIYIEYKGKEVAFKVSGQPTENKIKDYYNGFEVDRFYLHTANLAIRILLKDNIRNNIRDIINKQRNR